MPLLVEERERETVKAGLKAWWSNFTKSGKLSGNGGGGSSAFGGGGGGGSSSGYTGATGATGGSSTSGGNGTGLMVPSASTTGVFSSSKERKSGSFDRVFGEPLRTSLRYASVAISMTGEDGKQYVWGYVPIIVAKTGLFLKENATEVEGVFRIAGSQKRMRELQDIFDTPPKYGKQLQWDKYSVHDAASVLRRYLNQMPEPIVPLHLYNEFRNVMNKTPVNVEAAVKTYKLLVTSMPPANRYLLLYVLDLLAVFARKSESNLMPSSNLAVIFQPGIFSHPSHLQDANEHKVAIEVLQFLIDHQDNFVLAISPPPPTNVDPSELTSVSLPANQQPDPDVAELSDSDEDVGSFTVHEGGGAMLARRSTLNDGKVEKRRRNFFRLHKSGTSPTPKSAAESTDALNANDEKAGVVEDLGVGKAREPISPQGEIHEVGISSAAEKKRIEPITLPGVRRSKTVPSNRKGRSRGDQRSVSAKDPSAHAAMSGDEEEATTKSAEKMALTPADADERAFEDPSSEAAAPPGDKDRQLTSTVQNTTPTAADTTDKDDAPIVEEEVGQGETVDSATGLPTPPPSKHIEQPLPSSSEQTAS